MSKSELLGDSLVQEILSLEGIQHMKKLATGEWAGVQKFLFTYGLMVGLDMFGYRTRFCYPTEAEALDALLQWDGRGDPDGPWIKEKGSDKDGNAVDRPNPNRKREMIPLDPTEAMIDAGAQRLVHCHEDSKWPDDWSPFEVIAAKNEAERVWRSMWLVAIKEMKE